MVKYQNISELLQESPESKHKNIVVLLYFNEKPHLMQTAFTCKHHMTNIMYHQIIVCIECYVFFLMQLAKTPYPLTDP